MALSVVRKELPAWAQDDSTQYRIFEIAEDGSLKSPFVRPENSVVFPVERWIVDKRNMELKAADGNFYKSGFHFFAYKRVADDVCRNSTMLKSKKCIVKKILVRDVTATGAWMQENAGAAKKIFIER